MIPILYPQSETRFRNNGLGRLTDCISCVVTEERNGVYECEFEYPVTGQHYSDIQEGRIIFCTHDDTRTGQPFEIYKRSAEINGVVTFNASHISYRLSKVALEPFTATSCAHALSEITNHSVNVNQFDFWTDKEVSGNFKLERPKCVREMLGGSEGSILDVYGTGEYEWDKFTVKLHLHRGTDTGVEIRYGKNLADLTDERDYGEVNNGIYPYYQSSETSELITLPEKVVYGQGTRVFHDYWTDENYVRIMSDTLEPFEFDYWVSEIVPVDFTGDFDEPPTIEQLRAKTEAYINNSRSWLPDQNLEVDFVQLWQLPEYENIAPLQRVRLCDTVTVIHPALGVSATEKVVKVVYNVLLDRYDSMELGTAKTTLADVIERSTEVTMEHKYPTKSSLDYAVTQATEMITGGLGGHVVIKMTEGEPNEILIMDTNDINTAVNVLRINMNGIGFSHNGYEGPFHTAWTIDGSFVADFITSGTLRANLVKAGILSAETGNNYWNLDTGQFVSSLNVTGRYISINDGTIWSINASTGQGALFRDSDIQFFTEFVDENNYNKVGSIGPARTDKGNPNVNALRIFADNPGCATAIKWNPDDGYAGWTDAITVAKRGLLGFDEPIILWEDTRMKGSLRVEGYAMQLGKLTLKGVNIIGNGPALRIPRLVVGEDLAMNDYEATIDGALYTYGKIVAADYIHTRQHVNALGNLYTQSNLIADGNLEVRGDLATVNKMKVGGGYMGNEDALRVNGNISTESLWANGLVSAQTVTQRSDERLKEIYGWPDEADKILDELEPIEYRFKDGADDRIHFGFGARAVERSLENHGFEDHGMVRVDEDIYSLAYTEIIPLLVSKVKSLEKRIEELERMVLKNADS